VVLFYLATLLCIMLSIDKCYEFAVQRAIVHVTSWCYYYLTITLLSLCWIIISQMITSNDAPERRKKSLMLSIWNFMERAGATTIDWMTLRTQHWGRRKRGGTSSPMLTGRRVSRSSKLLRIYVASVVAMAAGTRARGVAENDPFDTDSAMIGIDNRCSGCITHVRSDIPGELTECKRVIKGFGGARQFRVWTGTIHWSWEDDSGRSHDFVIPNSYYIPDGKVRLLSPQHYAQSQKGSDRRGGAGETTTAMHTVLFWSDRQHKRTMPIDRDSNNVASFRLSAGYKKFHAYCTEAGWDDPEEEDANPILQADVVVNDAATVSDDEGDTEAVQESNRTGFPMVKSKQQEESKHTLLQLDGPSDTKQEAPIIVTDEEDRVSDTATSELLKLHYCFGHAPF